MAEPGVNTHARSAIAWIAVSTVLGWSLFDHLPYANLDRSWAHGLHLAHLDGHSFGGDIVFNYGPLGFAARPVAGTGSVYAAGVAITLLVTLGCAVAVFFTLARAGVRSVWCGPATAVVMLVAPFENLLIETALGVSSVALVRSRRDDGWLPTRIAAAAGAGAVVLGLIKVSIGVPAIAVVLLLAAGNRRALLAAVSSMVASFVVLWIASGQHLSEVASWLRGVAEISSGHVSAMNTGDPSRRWEYVAVAVIVVVGAALAIDRSSLRGRWDKVAVLAVAVGVGWFVFRQGFTLHSPRTRLVFFSAAWMIVGLAPWSRLPRRRRDALAVLVACSTLCFVVAAGSLTRLVNPVTPVADAFESARLTVSPGYRDAEVEAARQDARRVYGIADSMVDRIGSAPVMIDPYEISASWAYGLTWVPHPSMQRYLGYTDHLDDVNGDLLAGSDAPQFVLRQRFAGVGGRYAPAESPRFVMGLYCSFRIVESNDRWDLLERGTDRCGEPDVDDSIRVSAAQVLDIPRRAGMATWIAVDFDQRLGDRLATLILKPLSNPSMSIDGVEFRMLPATSASPALLVPAADEWDEGAGIVVGAATVSVDRGAEVTFSFTPVVEPAE